MLYIQNVCARGAKGIPTGKHTGLVGPCSCHRQGLRLDLCKDNASCIATLSGLSLATGAQRLPGHFAADIAPVGSSNDSRRYYKEDQYNLRRIRAADTHLRHCCRQQQGGVLAFTVQVAPCKTHADIVWRRSQLLLHGSPFASGNCTAVQGCCISLSTALHNAGCGVQQCSKPTRCQQITAD